MIGIYGGTFNPIHRGHLRAAEAVTAALGLSRLLFVPSARPPHKDSDAAIMAPAQERLAWVKMAVRDNPLFAADDIELERPGPSYLVDTLEALGQRFVEDELVFVAGRDAFCEMGSWKSPRALFAACHIAVTSRPPALDGGLPDWLPECVRDDFILAPDGRSGRHRRAGTWIRHLEIPALDVSASAIRDRLARGVSVRDWVPEAAHAAIVASGCYNEDPKGVSPDAPGSSPTPGEEKP